MVDHLAYVAAQEGIEAEPAALNVIARKADGAMRDALSIFDQVAASTRGNITYAATIENLNILDNAYYDRLLDAFVGCQVLHSWQIYKEIRDKGFDSHFFINGLMGYMRDLMVAFDPSTLPMIDGGDDVRAAMAAAAKKCTPQFIYKALCLLNDADLNYRVASNKQFLVEVTLAKICQLLSPSPDNSGQGEGQLKPIERPAAAQSQTPPAPGGATPARQQQAPPPRPQPAPGRATTTPPAVKKSVSLGPSISIRRQPAKAPGQSPSADSAVSTRREGSYTHDQLETAWRAFADANPHAHIMVNTMRASQPVAAGGDLYTVTVENEMQRDIMNDSMPALLKSVHDALGNDNVSFKVEINQGQSAPYTWNERDLLANIIERHPAVRQFITDLKLKL